MGIILYDAEENETITIATNYISGYFEMFKNGEIDQRTNSEHINVETVERYVKNMNPNLENEIGADELHKIICEIVSDYAQKSFEIIRARKE